MTLTVLKSKIHGAIITEANRDYDGSITIDRTLLEACGMIPYEKVLVADLANGNRFETYLIPGQPGSRVVCANGGAALLAKVGDPVIVMSFCQVSPEEAARAKPVVVRLDSENRIRATGQI